MADKIRVLVVDDSEDDRDLCRRALTRMSEFRYDVDEVDDGDAAIARLAHFKPDCILLDYSLPGRNGVEVLKLIRANNPFIPVLMLTGQGNEAIAVSAMQQGAQNYIAKASIATEQIHQAIQVAMAHCEMQRRLHEQRLSLEIFTRALAHDLKEPVRTIRSFISVFAASEKLSPQGQSYLTYVETAADRMSHLIDAVYDYTRLDASAHQPTREQVDVGELVDGVRADLAELIGERNAVISVDPLPTVQANRARLRQVLQNLIGNAIHHGSGVPQVRVSVADCPDHWLFSVSDNGPGIEEAQRLKIFEPFSRMSKHNGLGMGLAICKRIVEMHRGAIWCDADDGGGAVFRFTLPKAEPDNSRVAPSSAPAAAPTPLPMSRSNLATILLVDDNQAAIELARITLVEQSKLQCRILSATSGQDALALLQERHDGHADVDLILLDINMPRMDGFEVLAELAKSALPLNPPVIMCSTSSYDKDKERAEALGAVGYVEKPPQLRHLQPILNSILGLRLEPQSNGKALLRVA
ncbi:MAG: response regulator [Pseudomonadota bacterium]